VPRSLLRQLRREGEAATVWPTKKRGFYSTRDSHDIPTLHGKLVYFIKIFPCKYHGPFYRYFPWYSPVIVG
jgi:hypothetical protein